MESIRCAKCLALLFKAAASAIGGVIEIKCRRCRTLNTIRPPSISTERFKRQDRSSDAHGLPQTPSPARSGAL